jgi:hypothetical protein
MDIDLGLGKLQSNKAPSFWDAAPPHPENLGFYSTAAPLGISGVLVGGINGVAYDRRSEFEHH